MSEQDDIGYLADYPIYGVIPGINAFTLGARAINPRARIHLQWSTMKDAHTDEYFLSHGISYISSQNMISPTKEDRALGLYHLTENGAKNIATTVYQWGAFYEELINSIMQRILENRHDQGAKGAEITGGGCPQMCWMLFWAAVFRPARANWLIL